MRKHVWKQKATVQAQKALFLAQYVLQKQDSIEAEASNTSDANPNNA